MEKDPRMVDEERLELPSPMPFAVRIPLLKPWWGQMEVKQLFADFTNRKKGPGKVEELARAKFHSKYVTAINKGRTAAYLGMRALGVKEGDEIICPSFFCRTVTQAILQLGCKPVYADINEDLNISPRSVKRCISKTVKGVVMPHMFGKLARVDEIKKIAGEHNLFILDDAAVAAGAMHDGRFAGTLGDIGIISFNIGKQMNATGGGLLLTDNEDVHAFVSKEKLGSRSMEKQLNQIFYAAAYYYFKRYSAPLISAKRAFKTRTVPAYYRKNDGIPESLRKSNEIPEEFTRFDRSRLFNEIVPSRMSEIENSIAYAQLKKLDEINVKTAVSADYLSKYLEGLDEIILPQGIYPEHVFTYYTIIVKRASRYDLAEHLARKGIETQWTFYPLHLQEKFGRFRRDDLKLTDELWKKVLSLPVGPYLKEGDIRYIADAVKGFFAKSNIALGYKEGIKNHHKNLTDIKPEGEFFAAKMDILKEHTASNSWVLDLGCGNGNFSIRISPLVKKVYGVDFTNEMLKAFKAGIRSANISNVEAVNADICNLPFGESKFDLAYSYSALYYIKELDRALREINRVMKPAAAAIFELSNFYSIDGLHFKLRFRFFQNFMSLRQAKRLLEKTGFDIIKVRYFQFIPNFMKKGVLGRLLDRKVRGRTLGETVSSLPILRFFAFKFIFICSKK